MKNTSEQQKSLKEMRIQQAHLLAQIKRKQTLRAQRDRKKDTRRKVLVGAIVLDLMKKDADLHNKIRSALHTTLYRPVDRAVFADLLPKSDTPSDESAAWQNR